jgi:selenocysteine lyase/cysteine desulfurase
MLDLATLHRHFPALSDGFIFADNAGGSQCLQGCVDNVVDYLQNKNVQMGVSSPREPSPGTLRNL